MKLIFIRHGDPDYTIDSLTEKGVREAKLLANRVSGWDVNEFYCSPLGRAKKTASYSLEKMNRSATTYEWLKEFYYPVTDPTTGIVHVPWDLMPQYWTTVPKYYDVNHWYESDLYQKTPEIATAYKEICVGIDEIIKKHGYERYQNYYKVKQHSEDTIVIFCHLGVTCVMLGHILGMSPVQLWHNFFLAPTSVTIVGTEERYEKDAAFRIQVMGDTTHLRDGGEPISEAGYFTSAFQK